MIHWLLVTTFLTASRVLDAELKASGHDRLIAESLAALDRRN